MAEPLTNFEEPGFVSQITTSPSLYLLPGSVRVVALVGVGKATRSVLQESLARGTVNSWDMLANPAQSISRVYSDTVFQFPVSSYSLSVTGTIDASGGLALAGDTLEIQVGSSAAVTVTFTGTSPLALTDIISQINSVLVGAVADSVTSGTAEYLRIISGNGTVGDGGTEITITGGTAVSILGFVTGQVSQQIDWYPSITSTDPTVVPQAGDSYYVDYQTPKVAADLLPQSFYSLGQVTAAYGLPGATSNSDVSMGAQAAFANGASVVMIRQFDPAYTSLPTEVGNALSDLEAVNLDVLVPMTTDPTLWPLYLTHVSKMSSMLERRERRAILGVDETAGRLPISGVGTTWTSIMAGFVSNSGLAPQRIQVMNPGYAVVTANSAPVVVPGTFAAAALAGLMCSPVNKTSTCMTNKALAGINNLLVPDLLRSQKNILTGLGVTVIEQDGATIEVRRSVTTDGSSIVSQEPSIVFALDTVAVQLRKALKNRFVGTTITGNTAALLEGASNQFLKRFIADGTISNARNVHAVQNSVEPRQFDISLEVLPSFPFIWGSLNISVVIS